MIKGLKRSSPAQSPISIIFFMVSFFMVSLSISLCRAQRVLGQQRWTCPTERGKKTSQINLSEEEMIDVAKEEKEKLKSRLNNLEAGLKAKDSFQDMDQDVSNARQR